MTWIPAWPEVALGSGSSGNLATYMTIYQGEAYVIMIPLPHVTHTWACRYRFVDGEIVGHSGILLEYDTIAALFGDLLMEALL